MWTLVDLKDGFHQMRLAEDSQKSTGFITPFGVYFWRVPPMGVKVGPQVFQQMVAHILNGCDRSGPYIDDVLTGTGIPPPPAKAGKGQLLDSQAYMEAIPSDPKRLEECKQYHLEAVRECFQRIADAGLTVKPSKCFLFMRQVKYVGHILREGRRLPDPAKCSAISH